MLFPSTEFLYALMLGDRSHIMHFEQAQLVENYHHYTNKTAATHSHTPIQRVAKACLIESVFHRGLLFKFLSQ